MYYTWKLIFELLWILKLNYFKEVLNKWEKIFPVIVQLTFIKNYILKYNTF